MPRFQATAGRRGLRTLRETRISIGDPQAIGRLGRVDTEKTDTDDPGWVLWGGSKKCLRRFQEDVAGTPCEIGRGGSAIVFPRYVACPVEG